MRKFINIYEEISSSIPLYYATTKLAAQSIIYNGIPKGAIVSNDSIVASARLKNKKTYKPKDDIVILQFNLEEKIRFEDNNYYDKHIDIDRYISKGIDGFYTKNGVKIINPKCLKFIRVYSGVINDPIDDIDTKTLDEVALYGLERCTAVTINALLRWFKLPLITLNDVPVDNPGVLRILDSKGLSYTPYQNEAGRTLTQFLNMHRMGVWYILTEGHAMALIQGELFDAENKGMDGRKIVAAFQISRR